LVRLFAAHLVRSLKSLCGAEPKGRVSHCCYKDVGDQVGIAAHCITAFDFARRPLEAAGQTASRRNEKEPVVKNENGKIVLITVAMLAPQFSPLLLTRASAEDQSGVASVYSSGGGRETASGQQLNPEALTAAHRSLSFGTKVRVTNRNNGRSVVVTINDRGPFVRGRVIDITPAAARALGFSGLTQVTLNVGK
jgi:rare lipoprotein A